MKATHATGVVNLRPREDPDELLERLAETLHAAIEARHRVAHPRRQSIHVCGDPICQALSELQTAAQR